MNISCSSYSRTDRGYGSPNGGNGGKGGDVYLQTTENATQFDIAKSYIKGNNGTNGSSDFNNGKSGQDIIINIPAGTIVYEIIGKDQITDKQIYRHVADLNSIGLKMLICRGGLGGSGNRVFKTGYRNNNTFSTSGQKGEARFIKLELKTIADCGLIGMPNAGKSSILAALSAAKPKIANYPFTTLKPQVATVEINNWTHTNNNNSSNNTIGSDKLRIDTMNYIDKLGFDNFTVADLPGLIEGAHNNIGLGHSFLKHIERCSILIYVIDMSAKQIEVKSKDINSIYYDNMNKLRDPVQDYLMLQKELILYNPNLLNKPCIIFANKCDQNIEFYKKNVSKLKKLLGNKQIIIEGSAKENINIQLLVQNLVTIIAQIKTNNKTSEIKTSTHSQKHQSQQLINQQQSSNNQFHI